MPPEHAPWMPWTAPAPRAELPWPGSVVAALLNDPADPSLEPARAEAAPYRGAPRRPVLAVRPPRVLQCGWQAVWSVPDAAQGVQTGAGLGLVIGRPAVRLSVTEALSAVGGVVLVNDGSWPVESHYRPGLRWRARDGLCHVAPEVVPLSRLGPLERLEVQLWVDGQLAQRGTLAGRVRGVSQLLADITAFMSLAPGDLVLPGPVWPAPVLRAGQQAEVRADGLGALTVRVEAAA
jgi:5-oxopent-3-ene-1,2,5-tricarboxylate decarboxylase/2-hydroxyhepta-2,4-diene-1,7-dioate isomerase